MQKEYVEIARQKGEIWPFRKVVEKGTLKEFMDKFPDDGWFETTFAVLSETAPPVLNDEVGRFFEGGEKKGDLYFDFDSHEINKAKEDCRSIYEHLTKSLGVQEGSIKVYFSGSKGYHLLVDWDVLGLPARRDVHSIFRRFAVGLADSIAKHRTLDLKVYNARRLLRVPYSTHQVTKKKKHRVDPVKFEEIPETPYVTAGPAPLLSEALSKIQAKEADKLKQANRLPKEFFHEPLDCITDVMNRGVKDGMWNDTVYTVALYWKALGQDKAEIYDRIEKSKMRALSNADMREVSRTITSAFNSDKRFGLKDSVLEEYITTRDRERWRSAKIDEEYEPLNVVVDSLVKTIYNPDSLLAKYHVEALDKKMGGIIGGECVVLGGSTGTGKSEFAFHVAFENAKRGTPAAFISLELSNKDFIGRLVRGYAGIPAEKFWTGSLSEEEKQKVAEITDKIKEGNYPLFFRKKKTMMSIEELESIVSSLIIEQQCRLIVVDHLHYMGQKTSNDSENYHVSQCIRAINNLAVRYNVAIICIAHFRKLPGNQHRPGLHEFRDSSAIEQEASSVLIMWRDLDGVGDAQCMTEFRLAKNRKDLPLMTIKTKFNKNTRQYETINEIPKGTGSFLSGNKGS